MPSSISSACKGNLRELFNFHCAMVILMDYDEGKTARFVRTGGFAVNLLVQATQYCSLLMCVCVLGELQWPLTRDAPVIRLGLRTFVFAISGLLYGLQFPPTCCTDVLDTLERVFLKFGHYENPSESGEDCPLQENVPQFWQRMRSRIEPLAHSTLSKLGHVPGRSPWTATDFKHSGLLRVIRLSATTKIISRAILSGSVKAIHIYIEKPKTPTRPQYEKRKTDGYGDYLMTLTLR
ncbi:hypothetical protein TIFTF001_004252 [Ficus carica]|uniref:Uncharacterized protein n=1 Tax=Ficus carica TaxID=3494 RepID=A0AA87ZFF8_FICCA|nr:hypothetical protein TIFTF001_004252 [Ficus carica]